jgi:hypothetical protein
MTNEMKLLYALCEALGFEVETTLDHAPRKESKAEAMVINQGTEVYSGSPRALATQGAAGMLLIDEDGLYTSLLVEPIVDFRLHRKCKPEAED